MLFNIYRRDAEVRAAWPVIRKLERLARAMMTDEELELQRRHGWGWKPKINRINEELREEKLAWLKRERDELRRWHGAQRRARADEIKEDLVFAATMKGIHKAITEARAGRSASRA